MARSKASNLDATQLSLPFASLDAAPAPLTSPATAPSANPPAAPVVEPPVRGHLSPVEFRHASASHDLRIDGHLVAYELKRAKRRSIGFVVGPDGLSVSAPRWVGLAEIESALREKGAWILRKLAEQAERNKRL